MLYEIHYICLHTGHEGNVFYTEQDFDAIDWLIEKGYFLPGEIASSQAMALRWIEEAAEGNYELIEIETHDMEEVFY